MTAQPARHTRLRCLWILEPELRERGGHHLPYTTALAGAAARAGWHCRLVCTPAIEPDVRAAIEAAGVEVILVHAPLPKAGVPRVVNQARLVRLYHAALETVRHRGAPKDVALTFTGVLEWGATAAVELGVRPLPCPLVMHFFWWDRHESESLKPRALLHRGIVRAEVEALRRLPNTHFHVAAQADEMAASITKHLGRPAASLPFPLDWSNLPMPAPRGAEPKVAEAGRKRGARGAASYRPVVGYLGSARAEKGFPEFVDAVQRVTPTPAILAQTFQFEHDRDAGHAARVAGLQKLGARIVDHPVVGAAFGELFDAVDVLVLPYRANRYSDRPSTLLAEAIGLGKVVVAPLDTWLGKTVAREGVGVAYERAEGALEAAITRAVDDFAELSAASRARAASWRDQNSPDAFFDGVLRLAGAAPAA